MVTGCGITSNLRLPQKLKGISYVTIIRPVFRDTYVYGTEYWATKQKDERKLYVVEMRRFRCMLYLN